MGELFKFLDIREFIILLGGILLGFATPALLMTGPTGGALLGMFTGMAVVGLGMTL